MKDSRIEWTDHTFNPWIGCTKVSPGCAHCYAETLNRRMGWTQWGDAGQRHRTSPAYWQEPLRWDRAAARAGTRCRVFCASLADWLDPKAPASWRSDLLDLIAATPNLEWLLLTKRPQMWRTRMYETVAAGSPRALAWLGGDAPANVWFGVSVEDQPRANSRLPELTTIPALRKFLSVEPLLGPIDLSHWLSDPLVPQVQWVIVGGESGPGAREMKSEWVRRIRDDCLAAGVPFFFKQWGGVRKHETGHLLDGLAWRQLPDFNTSPTP